MAHLHKFEFEKVRRKLEEVKPTLPVTLANIAQNYFMNAFRYGQFDGKKWAEVKRRSDPESSAYKYPKSDSSRNSRGILIGKTRNLYGAVSHSIRKADWFSVVLGVDVPYAEYHNEGEGQIQRKFMGQAKELDDKLYHAIKKAIDGVFK